METKNSPVAPGTTPAAVWAADINHRYNVLPSTSNDGANRLMPRLAYRLVDLLPHVSISLTPEQASYVCLALEEIAGKVLPTMESPYGSLNHVDAELTPLIDYIDTNGSAFFPRPKKPVEHVNGNGSALVQQQNGHVHDNIEELLKPETVSRP